jgi:hypothetical protein
MHEASKYLYFSLSTAQLLSKTMFTSLRISRNIHSSTSTFRSIQYITTTRNFTTTTPFKMPESLKKSEVSAETDPSVAKQYDNESSTEEKFKDLYAIADNLKIGLMSTYRQGVGVCIPCPRATMPC